MSAYDTGSNAPFDLDSNYRTEVIVLGVISTISTVSVLFLLLHLFIVSLFPENENDPDEQTLLRTHFGVFFVFLFLSDLTQGLSGVIELAWVAKSQITPGPLCSTQAMMLHIGDVGTAIWNAIIAIHTFWAVVLGRRMKKRAAVSLIVSGWAACLLLTAIGPLAIQSQEKGPFYGVAGAWCFITENYAYQRVLLHYFPMLLSALIITILYVLVALVLFRFLIIHGTKWRFEAPTRKTGSVARDFFGSFSRGRPYRPSDMISTHSTVRTQHFSASFTAPPNNTLGREWDHPSLSLGSCNVKISAAIQSQAEMEEFEDPLSITSVRLKKLAMKMLWYPSVYIVLILPMTISRMNLSNDVSLSVMLGFMCLLLFMGTANTIIFACTRRLGPVHWANRVFHLQSKANRGNARPTQSQGDISLRIRAHRCTPHGIDHRSIGLPRKKSFASILTDIYTISSLPPVMHGISKDDLAIDDRGSKAGIELSGETVTANVPIPRSPSGPHMVGVHPARFHSPERQEQYSPYPVIFSEPPVQQREQERPQEWAYLHPYSRPPFPL